MELSAENYRIIIFEQKGVKGKKKPGNDQSI